MNLNNCYCRFVSTPQNECSKSQKQLKKSSSELHSAQEKIKESFYQKSSKALQKIQDYVMPESLKWFNYAYQTNSREPSKNTIQQNCVKRSNMFLMISPLGTSFPKNQLSNSSTLPYVHCWQYKLSIFAQSIMCHSDLFTNFTSGINQKSLKLYLLNYRVHNSSPH